MRSAARSDSARALHGGVARGQKRRKKEKLLNTQYVSSAHPQRALDSWVSQPRKRQRDFPIQSAPETPREQVPHYRQCRVASIYLPEILIWHMLSSALRCASRAERRIRYRGAADALQRAIDSERRRTRDSRRVTRSKRKWRPGNRRATRQDDGNGKRFPPSQSRDPSQHSRSARASAAAAMALSSAERKTFN